MNILSHLLIFTLSFCVIWFIAGMLVNSIDRVAKRYNQSGFTVAFFVLGFLTSISEIAVMVNATIEGVPQVSAGNLAGASLVILLFVVPLLAILGKGVKLKNTLSRLHLAIIFIVITLPNLFMIDGNITKREGIICLLVYGVIAYFIHKNGRQTATQVIEKVEIELTHRNRLASKDLLKTIIGGLFIFLASHLLVEETAQIAKLISIPSSIIGLILLSIGTNVPELVIAIRSIINKHKNIALGGYLGSALNNTPTFGLLAILNGTFSVEASEFYSTAILLITGLFAFYIFATSKNKISRNEGLILIAFYGLFLLIQIFNLIRFSSN